MQRQDQPIPSPGGEKKWKDPTARMRQIAIDVAGTFARKKILDARRKRTARLVILGTCITLGVLLTDFLGGLRSLENWLYDQRIYYFQHFQPPPTDRLVHIDIDDGALFERNLRWPWNRDFQGRIVSELGLAKPKVIFLDIMYAEGAAPAEDAQLVNAIHDAGNVIAATSLDLSLRPKVSNAYRAMVREFERPAGSDQPNSLLLDEKAIVDRLTLDERRELGDIDVSNRVNIARKEAGRSLVRASMLAEPNIDAPTLIAKLLPTVDPNAINPRKDMLLTQFDNLKREGELEHRFTVPIPASTPDVITPLSITPPLLPVIDASEEGGFVDFIPNASGDAKVRFIPLFVNINGRAFPHVSLTMVCKYLGVPLSKLVLEKDRVVIPRSPTGEPEIVIPVRTFTRTDNSKAEFVADIPWFGNERWQTMYDYPLHQTTKQHTSIMAVINILDTQDNLLHNMVELRKFIAQTMDAFDPADAKRIRDGLDSVDAGNLRRFPRMVASKTEKIRQAVVIAMAKRPLPTATTLPADALSDYRTPDEQTGIESYQALLKLERRYSSQIEQLTAQMNDLRTALATLVADKIVLVGMTATGAVDQYPTPLHVAPGVVAHGAMVNGMLTHHFWRRAPEYNTYLLTLMLGILATMFAVTESPIKAGFGTGGIILGYGLVNGAVLFDRYNVVVGVAGPMLAMILSCAFVLGGRFVMEIRERNRIQSRFSAYVDPELVNYIAAHPEENTFEGREKNMTVVFTDLEGFTTLSEQLKAGAIPILNDYVGVMVPIVRRHKGFLDKFLGDGIMFEFNTILPNPDHASHAIQAVMEMQQAMDPINESLRSRNLPTLRMRVGINTGNMIVGDAGAVNATTPEGKANNFTVLGDPVNLAARLEGANKPFGTLVLLTRETLEQTGGKFAVRPIASIRVKGKDEAVVVYEPVCPAGQETPSQKQLIELTTKVFTLFTQGDLDACMRACDAMDAALGHSKFTTTYHKECVALLANGGTGPDWDGTISLTEK